MPTRQNKTPQQKLAAAIESIVASAIDEWFSGVVSITDLNVDITNDVEEAVRDVLPDLVAEQVDDYMSNNFDPNDYIDDAITQDNLLSNVMADMKPRHAKRILSMAMDADND